MEEYFSIIEFSSRKEVIKVDRDLYDETLDVIDLEISIKSTWLNFKVIARFSITIIYFQKCLKKVNLNARWSLNISINQMFFSA